MESLRSHLNASSLMHVSNLIHLESVEGGKRCDLGGARGWEPRSKGLP